MKNKPQRGDHSFQSGAAGKGDANRTTNDKVYRENYDAICWDTALINMRKRWAKQSEDAWAANDSRDPVDYR